MDQNDIQQIGQVVEQKMEQVIGEFVLPAFERLEERVGGLETKMGGLEGRMGAIENQVGDLEKTLKNQYPDKNYLDDKLADLASEIGARIDRRFEKERKFQEQLLISLKTHHLLPEEDISSLQQLL